MVFWSVKGALTAACTTPPGKDQILAISLLRWCMYGIYACRAGSIGESKPRWHPMR